MTLDPKFQAKFDRIQSEFDDLKAMILDGLKQPAIPTGTSGTILVPDMPHEAQIIVDLESVNVRGDASTAVPTIGQLIKGQIVRVINVLPDAQDKRDATNTLYRWYALAGGGFVRWDVVRRIGDWSLFGLEAQPLPVPSPLPGTPGALLPLPVRGVMTNEHHSDGGHIGWDIAAPLGTPIVASANGSVMWVRRCVPCGDEGRSRTDTGVLTDPSWNFGYGNYMVVRYREGVLPASAQMAYPGHHAFVMVAHLQSFRVSEERVLVNAGQEIATLGSSGNSTGPHVHLEVRLSKLLNPASWDSIRGGLVDPGVLFARI